jgi:hypothetical protein
MSQAPIPHAALTAIIGTGWAFAIVALVLTLRPIPPLENHQPQGERR